MRILFAAADSNPPRYPSVSGIFGRGLRSRGHEVVAVLQGEGPPLWEGGPAFGVPRTARGAGLRTALSVGREWRALARTSREIGPADIAIVRDDPVMALYVAAHAGKFGPLVYQISHLHPEEILSHARTGLYGGRLPNLLRGAAGRLLRDAAIRRAAHILVMTPEAQATLGLRGSRTTVLPEGVDAQWSADLSAGEMRRDLGIEGPLVAYAGTLNRVRRLEVIIEAHAALLRQGRDVHLVIAGPGRDPSDERYLRMRASELDVSDRVRFLGDVPHARVASLFDAADIVLSPLPRNRVLSCNSPTKLFEAMHRARAIVASDIPEHVRVLAASGAGVAVPHRADAYADAMARLLDNPTRNAMGDSGRTWVLAHRTYQALADRLDVILRRLAGRREGSQQSPRA